jgi:hypothetical protein
MNEDDEIRGDLDEGGMGKTRRKKPLMDDELLDPLDAIDEEDTLEEAEEETEEDGPEIEEDEY